MSRWTLAMLAEQTGGRLHGDDLAFDRVCTDSRSLQAGDLFVAIAGPNFDGHDFASHALQEGACAVLVSRHLSALGGPQVVVEDTVAALGRFAAWWRQTLQGPLVGVTGSNGKTTVRSLIAAVLEAQWPGKILATQGNFNNEIGLPLTLLRLRPEDRAAVVEMGANHHGEIARLAAIAQPDLGLITNAGPAHLEGFGDLDGVARAKGELIAGLPAHGTALLNADDPRVPVWRELAGDRPRLEFGLHRGDVHIEGEAALDEQGIRAQVATPAGALDLNLALPGRHNLQNALAAICATVAMDVPPAVIARGLAAVRPEPGRLQPLSGVNGSLLVNDCYNANPGSLAVALEWLQQRPVPRWVVLGDMGELGLGAAEAHRQAGHLIREAGVERLFCIGHLAAEAAAAFGAGAELYARVDRLVEILRQELREDVTLLVKGSRAMGLERLIDSLRDRPALMTGRGG
ncbi:UDP-N-acetylmuramoyl-tripeptide--D-alanyl-D-alanine ligase [Gammaproteobacteria bacterium AB-CW1]|uniref:UDP-N-acetylmuramoyl-tripeptide--D-alanyl-D-alanine ligase n=1 Tax=Natronospira elongata TaxID=3110268 RepID=A0AAP6JD84_9GAMM|nr:UDP-N-acetylmuramoyl-tripeptide--D-alanyl-D-alanine ligase [Gammaproteobacteria bacterium AB-CW1]